MVISPEIFNLKEWKSLSGNARSILLYIMINCTDGRTCSVSLSKISTHLKISRSTGFRNIKTLTKNGLIGKWFKPGYTQLYILSDLLKAMYK